MAPGYFPPFIPSDGERLSNRWPVLEPEERTWLRESTAEKTPGSAAAKPVDEKLITETFKVAGTVADEKQAREKPFHEQYQAQIQQVEAYLKKIADVSHGTLRCLSFKSDTRFSRSHSVSIDKYTLDGNNSSLRISFTHPLDLHKNEFFVPMEITVVGDGLNKYERYRGSFNMSAARSTTSEFLGRVLTAEQIKAIETRAKTAGAPEPQ
ncbi:MAG TPA: hypothetical protein VIF12_02245 [Micavibrio sp.]